MELPVASARWHTQPVPKRIKPARANLESQLQQLRKQSERRELESAPLCPRLAALEGAEKGPLTVWRTAPESQPAARGPVPSTCLRNARDC